MSIATLIGPASGPRREGASAQTADWITLAEASRILRIHPTSVVRAALAGSIGHRAVPGLKTKYSRQDVERLAS